MIDEDQAIEAAKRELDQMGIPHQDREAVVHLEAPAYVVVFPPPPDMRAGDFRVKVSSEDGSVLDVQIER